MLSSNLLKSACSGNTMLLAEPHEMRHLLLTEKQSLPTQRQSGLRPWLFIAFALAAQSCCTQQMQGSASQRVIMQDQIYTIAVKQSHWPAHGIKMICVDITGRASHEQAQSCRTVYCGMKLMLQGLAQHSFATGTTSKFRHCPTTV